MRRAVLIVTVASALALAGVTTGIQNAAQAATGSTAWHGGAFDVDTPNLVRQANIVLGQANVAAYQSMPLGNGSLGAAVWAAGGFTAQLNRLDTMPARKSPGWVTIPGLAAMNAASNFSGYLDPYDSVLHESGGGMTASIYLRADKDEFVVDVTGADPNVAQTAAVNLWAGRTPTAQAAGATASLAETWTDSAAIVGSGRTFGSLAALTAGGRNVTASVLSSTGVQVAFNPNADGTFRVVVGAPTWTGGDAGATAVSLLGSDATMSSASLLAGHLAWWHNYWSGISMLKLSSADGSAAYLQKVRTLWYYYSAAERGVTIPGSHAGIADLFNWSQDYVQWYPAGFWFWNLRMQVAANIGGGAAANNASLFNLYTSNLANITSWTQAKMGGRAGICVPETMRFNGNGYQSDTSTSADSCDQTVSPTWNGSTISTGAEIGLWVWRQYQTTGDSPFLSTNYPLMRDAAKFLLAYATTGSDGLLHTVSNAHENQWYVQDPTNTIAAMQALFPATIAAAQTLNTDAALVTQLQSAQTKLPAYARTDAATHSQLLTAADDAASTTVLGQSYQPTATLHNNENDDLEPVWPYNQIGDASALTAIAKRTFSARVTGTNSNDCSFDAVDAARLGLGTDMATAMIALTKNYQSYPSGLAAWHGGIHENPYAEQAANVALALNESLAQDYDGLLRIAPAIPAGWDEDGTVYIPGKNTVSVQVHGGVIGTVGIKAGSTGTVAIRNPWPGQAVNVVDGTDESTVIVAATTAGQFSIPTAAGRSYLVQLVSNPVSQQAVVPLTDLAATTASHLGSAQIGLDPAAARTGAVTGAAGLCADDSGARSTNGNSVIVWSCSGAANQQWTIAGNGQLHTMGGCLTATSSTVIWSRCAGASAQSWTHQPNGALINSAAGLCLDDPGSGGSGTALTVATCSGASSQLWNLPTGPTVITGYASLCLNDSSAKTTDGNPIVMWSCGTAANEQWTIANNGQIQILGGCLTPGASGAVVWSTCTGTSAQSWIHQPTGALVNAASGSCLDDPNSGGSGTALITATCSGSATQAWTT